MCIPQLFYISECCVTGQTPLDIATAWADSRVYDLIKAKSDSMPSSKDKKKGGKPAGKRPKSTPSSEVPKETARVCNNLHGHVPKTSKCYPEFFRS